MNWKKLQSYKLHHVLFWLAFYCLSVFMYRGFYKEIAPLLMVTAVYMLAYASMYYVTQYRLIPITLKRWGIPAFIGSYILLSFLLSCLMFVSIQWILRENFSRSFGPNPGISFFVFFVSNMFTGGVMIGAKSILDRMRHQRLSEQKKQESLLSELSYLKAQVNPHFLFNAINSVYVLIKLDPDKAGAMLIKLSDLLRSQLYDFSGDKISIEQELEYLDNHIELEKLRRGQRIQINVEKRGDLHGFFMPPLLLIPFLENCFKHLSTYTDKPNKISLSIHKTGHQLQVRFFNTFDKQGKNNNHIGGIGLSNVKRRLELLFPEKHQLLTHINDDGHTVDLMLILE